MNMRKTVIFLILAVALIGCMAQASAANPVVVQAATTSALAGQIIEYRVSISGNPGLIGFRIKLAYDQQIFEAVEAEDGAGIAVEKGTALPTGNLLASKTVGGCQVLWYSTSESTQDGILFTLRFRVNDASAVGTYPVILSYSAGDTINAAEQPVALNMMAGNICVRTYTPLLYARDFTVTQGEEFDYTVWLQDNPGLASCGFTVVFDPAQFEVVTNKTTNAPVITTGSGFSGGSIAAKGYKNGVGVLWYTTKNTTADGVFVSIRLRAKEDAVVGAQTIQLTINPEQTLNEKEHKVELTAASGNGNVRSSVTVSVQLSGTHTATAKLTRASGTYAIIAFYKEDGQMDTIACSVLEQREATIAVHSNYDLSECMWKLFILDESFCPVSSCFSSTSS